LTVAASRSETAEADGRDQRERSGERSGDAADRVPRVDGGDRAADRAVGARRQAEREREHRADQEGRDEDDERQDAALGPEKVGVLVVGRGGHPKRKIAQVRQQDEGDDADQGLDHREGRLGILRAVDDARGDRAAGGEAEDEGGKDQGEGIDGGAQREDERPGPGHLVDERGESRQRGDREREPSRRGLGGERRFDAARLPAREPEGRGGDGDVQRDGEPGRRAEAERRNEPETGDQGAGHAAERVDGVRAAGFAGGRLAGIREEAGQDRQRGAHERGGHGQDESHEDDAEGGVERGDLAHGIPEQLEEGLAGGEEERHGGGEIAIPASRRP
jgi:hypothetical protein